MRFVWGKAALRCVFSPDRPDAAGPYDAVQQKRGSIRSAPSTVNAGPLSNAGEDTVEFVEAVVADDQTPLASPVLDADLGAEAFG